MSYSPVNFGSRFSTNASIASARVGRADGERLRDVLELEGFAHRDRQRLVQQLLRDRDLHRRLRGDAARQLLDLALEVGGRHDPVHDPVALGVGGVDHLREEGELLGLVQPDEARQQPRAAEVDRQAASHEDLREPRRVGRDDEVAAEGEVAARADGDAVDRGDRRLRAARGGATRHRPTRRMAWIELPTPWVISTALVPVRSAPEVNASPAPVSTRTRSSRDSATSSKRSMSACHIGPLIAFFLSGRLSVAVTTPWSSRFTRRSDMSVPYRCGLQPVPCAGAPTSDYVFVAAAVVVVLALLALGTLRVGDPASAMPEHGWPDDRDDASALAVRHVQPYEAVKPYRCPGCDHEIRPGEGHEVVVPTRDPGCATPLAHRLLASCREAAQNASLITSITGRLPRRTRIDATSKRTRRARTSCSRSQRAPSARMRRCFARVTASAGTPKASLAARLHLAEHDDTVLRHDEVELALAAAPVAIEHLVTRSTRTRPRRSPHRPSPGCGAGREASPLGRLRSAVPLSEHGSAPTSKVLAGELLDVDVIERQDAHVRDEAGGAVHVPHPGVGQLELEVGLTVVAARRPGRRRWRGRSGARSRRRSGTSGGRRGTPGRAGARSRSRSARGLRSSPVPHGRASP